MKLSEAQKTILDILKQEPTGMSEISRLTGYAKSGIRGRITELRQKGYVIELKEPAIVQRQYHLKEEPDEKEIKKKEIDRENANRIVNMLEKYNYFGKVIHYESIANKLSISVEETKDAIATLFDDYNVIQFTVNTVKILEKE